MNKLKFFMILMLFILTCFTFPTVWAEETEGIDAMLKNIVSEDAAIRTQAFKDLLALGPKGIAELTKRLVEPGEGDDAGVRFALHGLAAYVTRPGAEAERAAFAKTLVRQLGKETRAAVKRFLIEQLQIAGREECISALAICLINEEIAESARQALLANPSNEALQALLEALPRTKGLVRVGIIQALGQRRYRGALKALLSEASSQDPDIRLAALEALGRIGDPKAEPVLAAALSKGTEREQRIAFDAYLTLGHQLFRDKKRAQAEKVFAHALQAAPANYLRRTALIALSEAGSAEIVEAVVPYLSDADVTVRYAASECLSQIPDPKTSAALIKAMKKSPSPLRAALLQLLAKRKEPEALTAIKSATKDSEAEVRVMAFYLLGKLEDPALEPTLLKAAETGSEVIHAIALNAYIKLAEARLSKGEKETALSMFTRALEVAKDNALRSAALQGLAAIASPLSLSQVEALLQSETLRGDALRAYVAIAGTVAGSGEKQRAIEMLQRALELSPPRDVVQEAGDKLRELGVKFDPARAGGFVTSWRLIGSFPGGDIDREFPPEKIIDFDVPLKVNGRELRWFKHHTYDIQGVVDLYALMKPNENTTAYLYAEVIVEEAQDVLFKMGSDDGMKCWLNGELIHRFPQPRSLVVDQDVVKTHLERGVNRILLKVVNGGGGWNACLRITDPTGKPIRFEQKEE